MKNAVNIVSGLILAAVAVMAIAQAVKPDRAIKYRQGVMGAQGWNLGILGAMAKGDRPYDKELAVKSATFLNELVKMPWDGFIPGSDQGAPTKAKPEIWKEQEKFKQYYEAVQVETPKLVAAANSGDIAQLRTAVGAVGKACNNCHDDFQSK